MHLLPPSPSLPTLCPSVAQRLELGWAVIHSPGTHSRLDAAGLDPLPAGLVYDQGTEAPVPSPSWRQIIASFKCILSVEGNSFSGCRQSACAELIVTVALISIPAHPRSFPPSGMAGVQVRAWARCQGHPRYPNRSRAWPESSRVPAHISAWQQRGEGFSLAPPGIQPLFAIRESPRQRGRSRLLGVSATSWDWVPNCRQNPAAFALPVRWVAVGAPRRQAAGCGLGARRGGTETLLSPHPRDRG